MARKRAPHGPTDHLLGLLYGVISAPQQIDTTKPDFYFSLRMVVRPDHRQFLDDTFKEIEASNRTPQALARIKEEIIGWQDREFPVRWGKRGTFRLEAVKKSTRGLHRTIAEWTKVRTLQG